MEPYNANNFEENESINHSNVGDIVDYRDTVRDPNNYIPLDRLSGDWFSQDPSLKCSRKWCTQYHKNFPYTFKCRNDIVTMSAMNDWRNRRDHLNHKLNCTMPNYVPMHYSIANYCTDSIKKEKEPPNMFDEDILSNLHMIPNPLQKNLADTLVTGGGTTTKMAAQTKVFYHQNNEGVRTKGASNPSHSYASLTGIGNFFSNVLNVISGAMFQPFQRRPKSPVYFECMDVASEDRETSPALESWQPSKINDQNKNERAREQFSSYSVECSPNVGQNMNEECRTAVAHCEDKLNKVRMLLSSKTVANPPRYRPRRPRKVFVEPGSVEEVFEDAFAPEDFVRLANDDSVECMSICNNQKEDMIEVEAPKIKTDIAPVHETMEIVKTLPVIEEPNVPDKLDLAIDKIKIEESKDKQQVVNNCEDKVSRLKALLQRRRLKNTKNTKNSPVSLNETKKEICNEQPKKPTKTVPITRKSHDKHFKNPNRLSGDKRRKAQMNRSIQDDILFANEIDSEDLSSVENSPAIHNINPHCRLSETSSTENLAEENDHFNEVTGRFRSASTTESEDSFQIVFTDSPKPRPRRMSDCDSEDSFIMFEENNCYTSNDVFGDELSNSDADSDSSDDESDVSDSGLATNDDTLKFSQSISRTIGDLTDDSLFDDEETAEPEDEVDCPFKVREMSTQDIDVDSVPVVEKESKSLLLNDSKKLLRAKLPSKRVHFSPLPPKVHVMRVWAFAARQARAGHWERHALDRERFKRRIADVDMAVSWVLKPQHRSRIMFQRFMPWWNAQKRKELAEKKEKQEQERLRKEEDDLKANNTDGVKKDDKVIVSDEKDIIVKGSVGDSVKLNEDDTRAISKGKDGLINKDTRLCDAVNDKVEKDKDLTSEIKRSVAKDVFVDNKLGVCDVNSVGVKKDDLTSRVKESFIKDSVLDVTHKDRIETECGTKCKNG